MRGKAKIQWRLLLGCLLAALLLLAPAVLCCGAGGWLLPFGLLALAGWLRLGGWVMEAWREWHRQGDDNYV